MHNSAYGYSLKQLFILKAPNIFDTIKVLFELKNRYRIWQHLKTTFLLGFKCGKVEPKNYIEIGKVDWKIEICCIWWRSFYVYIHHLMCVLNKVANVLLHSYFCVNNIPIFGKLVPKTKVSKTYIVCLFIFWCWEFILTDMNKWTTIIQFCIYVNAFRYKIIIST